MSRLRRLAGALAALSLVAVATQLDLGIRPSDAAPAAAGPPRIVFPVAGHASWSDTFGACRGSGCSRSHQGQDIFGHKGQPLISTIHGFVDQVQRERGISGNYVSVRDPNGWRFLYIHVNNDTPGTDDGKANDLMAFAPGIRPGTRVRAGQVIAYLGDSGNAEHTSPHVHFEIRDPSGRSVNPAPSLRAALPGTALSASWQKAHGSFGTLSTVESGPGGVYVDGWAIDRDGTATVDVHVYVDGYFKKTLRADVRRSGLARYGKGDRHGFEGVVPVGSGAHKVCVYAADPTGGPATALGCRTASGGRGSPMGVVERLARATNGRVELAGWAIDPDTGAAVDVRLRLTPGGGGLALTIPLGRADAHRADVGRAHPGWGPEHGFAEDLGRLPAGKACVVAVDRRGGHRDTSLGCTIV